MQTVISSLALTSVDDAIALVAGFASFTRDLVVEGSAVVRATLSAPIDRLARTCDVAGVLPAASGRRFDVFGLSATFRALHDLT